MANEQKPASRREFLRDGMLLGAVAAGGAVLPAASEAAKPPKRSGGARMKLSVAAYSYRKYLGGKPATMSMEGFVREAARLNLDGCEPTSYWFPNYPAPSGTPYLLKLKQLAFRLGLDISGTAISNDFCLPPGPARDETLAHTRQWIDDAAILGAPVIRIFAGRVAKGDDYDAALARCVEGINESVRYAAQKGVFLALENHGGITSTADQILSRRMPDDEM